MCGNEGSVFQALPEDVVLDAMGAYDSLARHAIMTSREDGLTKTQTDILMRLAWHGKCSMSMLADELSVSKEHVTRAVGALIEKGLADKHRSTENFRRSRFKWNSNQGKRNLYIRCGFTDCWIFFEEYKDCL